MNDAWRNPWARFAALAGGLALVFWLVSALRSILTPFAAAFALAYFLNPAANALEDAFVRQNERRRTLRWLDPRAAAVGILAGTVVVVLVAALLFVVPAASDQVADTAQKLPTYVQSLRAKVQPAIEKLNLRYPELSEEIRDKIQEGLKSHIPQILSPVTHALQSAFSSLLGFILTVLHFIVIPIFTLYLLHDMNRIREGTAELVPERFRAYVHSRLAAVDRLLSAFVRGQITVCLIMGTLYAVALTACGLPMSVLVGYAVAFFNLVPFMATALGLPLVLLLSFIDQGTLAAAATVAGVFVGLHFVESHFITPRVVGGKLGLHPVVIMLAVFVGGHLFGFFGMLLAVPTTAALSVFWTDLRELYLRSGFYLGRTAA